MRCRRRLRHRGSCDSRAQRAARTQREGRLGLHPGRRPAGSQVQGRVHDRRSGRRYDDSRVLHDQSRDDALAQDDDREGLLHHVVRASCARLPCGRRRDHREQRAARRPRDGRRKGDHCRPERGTPVREDRQVLLRGWLFAHLAGCAAVHQGGGPYRLFFRSELNLSQAKQRAETELKPYPEVQELVRFIEESGRGVVD